MKIQHEINLEEAITPINNTKFIYKSTGGKREGFGEIL